MADHKDNEVTSHFSYHKLFQICKKLNNETSKLKQVDWNYKETIYFLEIENQNLMEEVETLREKQSALTQVFSPSREVLVESDKCSQCDVLKNENKDIQNTL